MRGARGVRRTARRAAVVLAALAAALARGEAAVPGDAIVVESWSEQPIGRAGVPIGWEGQGWGRPRYEFRVEAAPEAGASGRALRMRSAGDNSTIARKIGAVDVRQHAILEWRWRVVTLPAGGDARVKATDDEAAQLYVVFPRFPSAVRSRVIGYVWDATAPAGTIVQSPSSPMVTYVVVRSGAAELDRWITERRNVREDFRRIYGEEPDGPAEAISLGIDSNDTRSTAESYVGEIVFRRP